MTTPAKRNRALAEKTYPGTVLVATCANREYLHYSDLFSYCIRKAYPDYRSVVSPIPDFIHPYAAAAMRFAEPSFEGMATDYTYTLITDIDILHYRESVPPHVQHCREMEKHGLSCYSNHTLDGGQCPGVHFVTKDWWEKTRESRHEEQAILVRMHQRDITELRAGYDERALLRIIRKSDLEEPPAKAPPLSCHGIHLGKWRKRRGRKIQVDPAESTAAKAFLADEGFMDRAESVPGVVEILKTIGG